MSTFQMIHVSSDGTIYEPVGPDGKFWTVEAEDAEAARRHVRDGSGMGWGDYIDENSGWKFRSIREAA